MSRGSRRRRALNVRWLRLLRSFQSHFSSSLTRRIIVLNLGGLVALLAGFLYLNQFREGLIDARVQSLLTQGEIIAAAIAASATVDTDSISIDPDKLLKLAPGDVTHSGEADPLPQESSLNPERAGPLLRRLVTPTRLRARIYNNEGALLLDSRPASGRTNILRFDLPAVD
ncbi:MAG: histidine kinase, partial [Methylocystaceae bacterium]|nr:histidine kinase [Methylocystaceae bacterium]